ncbi:MAG: aminoacyl-histidine dipeptidase [Enterobacterales bacterium]|nr:aminoacyl-histidine dipeptidase [Enterobacterales bacterium]
MSQIDTLKPRQVWSLFKHICDIPHPSKHEIKLRDHIKELCDAKDLHTIIDKTGNLIVKKSATKGMENRLGVVMQGHVDMVPQKNADSDHNFVTDPITTYVDGDWLKAQGTTLGSDNGLGVAAGLAVMLSDDIPHGPLELLCTIEEETSMKGAFGLEAGILTSDILMNLDTEDEGELYVGCAGGADIVAKIPLKTIPTPHDSIGFEIAVTGLRGGHSGLDIDQGRANANQLVNRFLLTHAEALGVAVAQFNGGTLRNAIPRESFTLIAIAPSNRQALESTIKDFESLMRQEYGKTEPNLSIKLIQKEVPSKIFTKDLQHQFCLAVAACVNGVIRMSDQFEGIVETSNNLGIVKSNHQYIEVVSLARSLVNSARDYACRSIAATFELIGAETQIEGAYPGWKPNPDSAILNTMIEAYENLFGKKPAVKVIHAGLECGLLGEPYPNLDMISFGPTIKGAHSPDERAHIASVQKFWDYLLYSLKNIPHR